MIPSVFAAQGNASSLLLPAMASIATLAGSTPPFPSLYLRSSAVAGPSPLGQPIPRSPSRASPSLFGPTRARSIGWYSPRTPRLCRLAYPWPPYLVRRRPRLLGRPLHRLGHHQASDRPSRKQARLCPCHPRLLARSMVDPHAILLVPPFTPASARPIDSTEYSIRLRLKHVRHLTLSLSVRSTTLMICPARHPVRHPSHHSEPLL